jgi:hypothetical protein
MKNAMKSARLAALMLLLCGSTYAASFGAIGVSFLGDTDINNNGGGGDPSGWVLAPADIAGVVPQANWNNISTPGWGSGAPTGATNSGRLVDYAGNLTAVALQFVAGDAWNSSYTPGLSILANSGPTNNPDEKLMKGVIKQGNQPAMTFTFTNLPNDTYEIYVYGAVDSGAGNLDTSVGSTTNYWTEPQFFTDPPGFIDATSTDPNVRAAGNYVHFTGVTPVVDGTNYYITITAGDAGGSAAGVGIAGLQIFSSTGYTNRVPVAITSQPQPTTVVVGWPATFAAGVSGPFPTFQWFSNSVPVPGATGAKYTTPPVAAGDNGTKYKVTVANNVNSITSDEVALTVVVDPGTRVASIGARFLGDGWAPAPLNPGDQAGVVAQTNWNNIRTTGWGSGAAPPGGAISAPFIDGAGNFTAVQLQFVADDAWNSDGPTNSPNDILMKGILKEDAPAGSSLTLTVTNLPPAIYDVYVYGDVNNGPVDLDASIGARTNYWTEPAAFADGAGFIEATSSDPSARAAGNYVRFTGATPADGAITVTATYQGGSDGLGIAGLQIVSSAAFPTNTVPLAITRQPETTLAATGSGATFVVQVSGPFPNFQWFSNSVAIPGATSGAYTTPPVTAGDIGAKYKVTVTNNVNSLTSYEVALIVGEDSGTRVASIGARFLGDGWVPALLSPGDQAGVVAQTNWNNIPTAGWGSGAAPPGGAISAPFLDSAGNLTAVQLQFVANDAWNSDGPTNTPNDLLMKGILKEDAPAGSAMTLAFWNLGPAFYDVYVYGDVNNGPAGLNVNIGATTNYWTEPAAFDDGTGFIDGTSSDPSVGGFGNYVKFTGVTPVSGEITVTATYQGGSDGLGIAGLQIVSSAAFPANPKLTVALQGGQTVVSWNSPLSFQLQYRTDLGQASWTDELTPPVIAGNQVTVRLPATGPARFFRLVSR